MSGGLSATELAIAAGTATAAGAGISAYSQNQALRKQDQIAATGIRNQDLLRNQANAGVQKTIQKVGTDNASNVEAAKNAQQTQYVDALRRAAPVQDGSLQSAPGASARYAKQVVDAQASNKAFGAEQAGLMARTDAPQLTQLHDQQTIGDEATQLGLLNDTSNSQNNLTKLQVGSVQQNPWLLAASGILKGAGAGASVYAGGMGGGKLAGGKLMADNGLGSTVGSLA